MSIEPVLSSAAGGHVPALETAKKDSPAKVKQAATEFESFLLAQMLKSAREASGGGIAGGAADDSGANSTMIEIGEQQFAQALASSGGLGIAKMVLTGLTKYADR